MSNQSNAAFFKSLKVLHLALCAGLIVFCVIAAFTAQQKLNTQLTSDSMPFVIMAVFIAVLNVVISQVIFSKLITTARTYNSTSEKLTQYQSAFITKMAVLEGAGILNMVVTLITGSIYTLSVAVVIACFMYFQKPTAYHIAEQLELLPAEKLSFEDF